METEIKNIYPDEQAKLDEDLKLEIELSYKLYHLLEDYGYTLEPVLVDGMPEIKFVKITS